MKDMLKNKSTHEDVQELLPWFVNETLDDKEQLKVMTHLSECTDCQKERDRLQQLRALVQQEDPANNTEYKPSFEKLMDKIDQNEQERVVQLPRRTEGQWIKYAAAASVVLGLTVVLVINQPQPAETLSVTNPLDAMVVEPKQTLRLSLTFEEGLDSTTMRNAFVNTGAYIVSGPDESGRYVVEVMTDSSEDELIHSMTEVDGVKYAALLD